MATLVAGGHPGSHNLARVVVTRPDEHIFELAASTGPPSSGTHQLALVLPAVPPTNIRIAWVRPGQPNTSWVPVAVVGTADPHQLAPVVASCMVGISDGIIVSSVVVICAAMLVFVAAGVDIRKGEDVAGGVL